MRLPSDTIQQTLGCGDGPWLLEVERPPGMKSVSSIGWTFPRRTAAMSFARCLRASNPRAHLEISIRSR